MISVYSHDSKGRRQDVHAPSAINPGDYTFVRVGDKRKHPVDGGPGGTCHHCGKAIRWEVHFKHNPSEKVVTFGETCTQILEMSDNRIDHEMVVLKRRAQNEKFSEMRRQDWQERRESFDTQYPLLRDFLTEHDFENEKSGFVHSMKSSYEHYGSLLPRQTEALQKILKQREEAIMKLLTQPIPDEALQEGRYEISGEILSSKFDHHSLYPARKMRVMLPDGNKIYGTMPALIVNSTDNYVGLKVRFTATVKQSPNDEHFGYFNRPTGGAIL